MSKESLTPSPSPRGEGSRMKSEVNKLTLILLKTFMKNSWIISGNSCSIKNKKIPLIIHESFLYVSCLSHLNLCYLATSADDVDAWSLCGVGGST